ncbi:hypothetical protein [Evansella cellulosilytica]|uniref:Uncharacterized protein n=1 Tax=Evansella cellulosilytica (strain ATCC 21833 / DSM 2522 / FERM P-1141 / JCM 9156 / N-4) TaxID=649639 RepID=E6TZT9_EVAC2|nr:hypothetical protein [Evansella cellulosilytica]ADU32505.1 hypothetical protein Bcell_4278 [Evansella cellulosilytica DSM 2522]
MYEILPKEYWKKQDYLLYAYDVLRDMLKQADSKKLSNVTIKFNDIKETQSFEKTDDIFKWLDFNGYHDKALNLFSNHIFFLLLKDFCYYIYESISCAERGKVTVAYSLLRKPIRDNLLYMEWLLADHEEFYHTFLHKPIEEYDVSNYKIFTRDRIKKIIKEAGEKTHMGEAINYNNLVYTFRFNGKEEIGLQRIWNQSMHLVTTSPNYKTEKNNLNFVFADEEVWNDYWRYYYFTLPQLMAYVLEICESLFVKAVKVDSFNLFLNRCIRYAKYADVYPSVDLLKELKSQPNILYKTMKDSGIVYKFKCEHCEENIKLTLEVLDEMVDRWSVYCSSCYKEHNICKYYTDSNYSNE